MTMKGMWEEEKAEHEHPMTDTPYAYTISLLRKLARNRIATCLSATETDLAEIRAAIGKLEAEDTELEREMDAQLSRLVPKRNEDTDEFATPI
jgi:hypothetical protein